MDSAGAVVGRLHRIKSWVRLAMPEWKEPESVTKVGPPKGEVRVVVRRIMAFGRIRGTRSSACSSAGS